MRMEAPENTKYIIPYIIKVLEKNMSAKKVRRAVSLLCDNGYLQGREYIITEYGRKIYENYITAWQALCHAHENIIPEKSEREMTADYLITVYPKSALFEIAEKYREEQKKAAEESYGELITDTDFSGKIPPGVYKVAFEMLTVDKKHISSDMKLGLTNREAQISSCFHPSAALIIEPLKSCLELTWRGVKHGLYCIRCCGKGQEDEFRVKDGKVRIPLTQFTFEYVPAYSILQGELKIQIITIHKEIKAKEVTLKEAETGTGKTVKNSSKEDKQKETQNMAHDVQALKKYTVILELPLVCN